MKLLDVLFVKIYITEASGLLKQVLSYLKENAKIRGVSVFRAIKGYGETGNHNSSIMDLSLDLPLCVEFFDTKEKAQAALEHLNEIIKPDHIVFWEGKTCERS